MAVFDTAFHATMPEAAARYAIDAATADRATASAATASTAPRTPTSRGRRPPLLGKDPADVNVIVLHLGNGASASAVRGGVCVDTSMGLTPLEGLVMGTRSGDLDPAVVFHLERVGGMGTDEIDDLLNKRSGLLGLCGDNDMREIGRRMGEGDPAARLAFDVYVHRLRRYIGAFTAVLGRVDADRLHRRRRRELARRSRAAALDGLEQLGIARRPGAQRGARPARRGWSRRTYSPGGRRGGPHRRGAGDRPRYLRTGRAVEPSRSHEAPDYSAAEQTDRIAPMRRAKIVCTLGPAVDSYDQLKTLVEAGMNVARLNFSHGSHAEHEERYQRVRKVADETGRAVGVLADLQGPKIRLAQVRRRPGGAGGGRRVHHHHRGRARRQVASAAPPTRACPATSRRATRS